MVGSNILQIEYSPIARMCMLICTITSKVYRLWSGDHYPCGGLKCSSNIPEHLLDKQTENQASVWRTSEPNSNHFPFISYDVLWFRKFSPGNLVLRGILPGESNCDFTVIMNNHESTFAEIGLINLPSHPLLLQL